MSSRRCREPKPGSEVELISIAPLKNVPLQRVVNVLNGEKFIVELENATLTNFKGFLADKPDLTLTIKRSDLEQTMMGQKHLCEDPRYTASRANLTFAQ